MINEHYKDARLIMAGDGPSLEKVKNLVNKLEILDLVEFVGKIKTNELNQLVSSAWVNIHSSVTEGFGLSIIESSSAGTPTVAYNVPGVRDVLKNGINGYLVENNNRSAMLQKVLEIFENKEWMISSSRNEALEYSWENATSKWNEHLESLLKP